MFTFLTTYRLPITLPTIYKSNLFTFLLFYPHFPQFTHNIYIEMPKYEKNYRKLKNVTQALLAMLVTFFKSGVGPTRRLDTAPLAIQGCCV